MRPRVVPEGFCSAVPCKLSKPRTTAKCFPELAQLLKLCLVGCLTVRTEISFCSFLHRFIQSPDKRRDDISPVGGNVYESCVVRYLCMNVGHAIRVLLHCIVIEPL